MTARISLNSRKNARSQTARLQFERLRSARLKSGGTSAQPREIKIFAGRFSTSVARQVFQRLFCLLAALLGVVGGITALCEVRLPEETPKK
jgi:hypothetical protein